MTSKRVGFEWFKYFKPKERQGFDWLQYCGECIHYDNHMDWCTAIDLRPWKKLDAPVCALYQYKGGLLVFDK